MYICICNAVTDKQILKAQQNGCGSIHEVTRALGVGNCCGSCIEQAEDLLMQNSAIQKFNPALAASLSYNAS